MSLGSGDTHILATRLHVGAPDYQEATEDYGQHITIN